MFGFKTRLDGWYTDNKCLTFLALHGKRTDIDTDIDYGPEALRVGQTYSLETGLVGWPDPETGEQRNMLSLGNSRLRSSSWEPMTGEKFELMALERGIIGDNIAMPERVTDTNIVTVVVSPQGFVFHWDHTATVSISHVSRLADIPQPLVSTSMDAWHLYKLTFGDPNRITDIGGSDEPPPATLALVDKSGTSHPHHQWCFPKPRHPNEFIFDSLGEAAANIAPLLTGSKNYTSEDHTPAAAEFVLRQFGVDVDDVNWHAAIEARFISSAFTHSASFDPAAACAALRLAIVNNRVKHTAPAAIDQARDAADQTFSRELTTRIQQHLKSSGPAQ